MSIYFRLFFLRLAGLLFFIFPLTASSAEPLRVIIVSDLNGSYGSTKYEPGVDVAMARIVELQPNLVLSTGDMVAGQRRPHLSPGQVASMWEAFHAHVSTPLQQASIPFAVTPGNHDGSAYKGFTRERDMYAQQWESRKPALHFLDDANYPFYYAFDLRGVLFISLDTTVVGGLPDTQRDWLAGVLAEYGASHRKRVVFGHMPLWPTAQGREREYIGDTELQALLERENVDVFLSGHHHTFYPGAENGVAYISQSCLGAGPRALIGTRHKSQRSFTLLDFSDDTVKVAAYAAPRYTGTIGWHTLPREIPYPGSSLKRLDLSGAAKKIAQAPEN